MSADFEEDIRKVHRKLLRAMKRETGCRLSKDEVHSLSLSQLGEDEEVTKDIKP